MASKPLSFRLSDEQRWASAPFSAATAEQLRRGVKQAWEQWVGEHARGGIHPAFALQARLREIEAWLEERAKRADATADQRASWKTQADHWRYQAKRDLGGKGVLHLHVQAPRGVWLAVSESGRVQTSGRVVEREIDLAEAKRLLSGAEALFAYAQDLESFAGRGVEMAEAWASERAKEEARAKKAAQRARMTVIKGGSGRSSGKAPLVYYHGGHNWEGPPTVRPSKSAKVAVHGPGLYLTSNRDTAARYAKGGGAVMRIEVEPDLRLVEDVDIPVEEMLAFVQGVYGMRHKKEISDDLRAYAARRSRALIPANVLGNLMNHYGVAFGKPGAALVEFYLRHGIDADLVDYVLFSGMDRDEKWLVLYNPDRVISHRRLSAKDA